MTARTRNAPAARAFTLIEVMLAVVILGLGLLGLSALFAGAANTQRRATLENRSVSFSRNAEAILSRTFGALEGPGVTQFSQQGLEGVWLRVPSAGAARGWPLTLDLLCRTNRPIYSLTASDGATLYTGPNEFSVGLGPYRNASPSPIQVRDDNTGIFDGEFVLNPFLPDRRVDPRNMAITVTRMFWDPSGTANPVTLPPQVFRPLDTELDEFLAENGRTYAVLFQPEGSTPVTENPPAGAVGNVGRGFERDYNAYEASAQAGFTAPATVYPPGFDEFIWLYTADPPANRNDRAYIRFVLKLQQHEWISSIRVEPYRWRNDTLVSLNDRLQYEPDPTFPGGRRPVLGYTALARKLRSGGTQLMVLTYALEPLEPVRRNNEGIPFAPPETCDTPDDEALLREVFLELGYDVPTQRFYVEGPASDPEVLAALEPGQILVMAESQNLDPQDPSATPGSDIPVRVVSSGESPLGANIVRAVIDGSPRVGGRSPLRTLSGGSTVTIRVWAFNPIVRSLTSDRAEWRVRPIEARVFQIGASF